MTEQIDNIIILGRGVPEQISDGRITVCVAGWCESHGFIRLYPSRIDSPLRVWNVVSVEVERNPKDSRRESWKFPDSRSGWENINQHIDVTGCFPREHRMGLLDSVKSPCVMDINDRRDSLGIIKPTIKRTKLAINQLHMQAYQPLFENMEHASIPTKRDHVVEPRICYLCGESCRAKQAHDMQLLDWGCYQWIKKNPGDAQQIWRNMGIGLPEWVHYFLVGNQANQRTSYMIINVLRQKVEMIQTLLFADVPGESNHGIR